MASLMIAARGTLPRVKVQTLVAVTEKSARTLAHVTPFRPRIDTLARGRQLAYRWSRWVPGSNCLHRAVATRLWLAGYRIDSHVVLGFRKRDSLEGHAWLEVRLPDAATLMFVSDEDGYEIALRES